MQLARLRAAWHDSALAMNQLKEYMVSENKSLVKAFRWQTSTLPSKYKKNSISYYLAIEAALISGLMFGAAIYFLQRAFAPIDLMRWVISALSGSVIVYLQLLIYQRSLK
jgi:hypothetical protein